MKKYLLILFLAFSSSTIFAQYSISANFTAVQSGTNSVELSLNNTQLGGVDSSCPGAGQTVDQVGSTIMSLVYEVYRNNVLIDKIFFTRNLYGSPVVKYQATTNEANAVGYFLTTPSDTFFPITEGNQADSCLFGLCYPTFNTYINNFSKFTYTNPELCNGTSFIADYKFVAKYYVGSPQAGFIIGTTFCKASPLSVKTVDLVQSVNNITNENAIICNGESISFTAGNSVGSTFSFFKDAAGTIPYSNSGNTLTINSNAYNIGLNSFYFRPNGCQIPLKKVDFTVVEKPSSLVVSGNTNSYCIGSPVLITPTAIATNPIFEWSTTSNFTTLLDATLVDNQGRLSFTTTNAGNYTYYVRAKAQNGNCYSAPQTVSFTVNTLVSNVTVTPQNPSVCYGENVVFSASAQNATSYKWTSDVLGVNILGTSSTLTLNQSKYVLGANTIYLTVTNTGGCNASAIPVAFTINATPTALQVSGTQTGYCTNTPVLVTPSSTYSGSGNLVYEWSNNSNFATILDASFVNGQGQLSFTPTTTGTTTYFVRAKSPSNCYSNIVTVPISVYNTVQNISVVNNNATICKGTNITFQVGADFADNYTWYKDAGTTVPIGSGQSLTLQPSSYVLGLNTIYVKATNSANCNISPVAVNFTVNESPTNLVVTGNSSTYCTGNSILIQPSATGLNLQYQWSNNANFTSLLGSSFVNSNGELSYVPTVTGSQTFYVRAYNGSCYSNIVTVTYNVNAGVGNLQVSNDGATFCQGQNIAFTAGANNATSYNWYKFPNATGLLYTGTTYNPQPTDYTLNTLTKVYVQASTSNGCQSALQEISYTVSATPTNLQTIGNAGTYCLGNPILITPSATITGASSLTYEWSATSNFATILGASFVDNQGRLSYTGTNSGTVSYFVRAKSINGCYSASQTVTFTITNVVSNVTVTPINPSVCFGQDVVFTASATNATSYKWTSDNQGVNVLGTNSILTLDQTQYVLGANTVYLTVTNAGNCNATPIPVAFTVNSAPTNLVVTGNSGTFCTGNPIFIQPSATGTNLQYQWSTNANFTSLLGSSLVDANGNLSFVATNTGTQTYFVRSFNGNCYSSTATVTFNVNAGVTNLQVSNDGATFCQGQNISFTAGANNANSYTWYKFPNATGILYTGATYTPQPTDYTINSINKIYVQANNNNGCQSALQEVSYTVNAIPSNLQTNGNQNNYCVGSAILITPSATITGASTLTYEWSATSNFASILGASFVDSQGNLNFSAGALGLQTYFVRAKSITGCYSTTIAVNFTVSPNVTNVTVTNDNSTFCKGQNATFSIGGTNATSYAWFSDALGTIAIGNSQTITINTGTLNTGINKIYGQAKGQNNCNSPLVPVTFTVNESPTNLILTGNSNNYCLGNAIFVQPSATGSGLEYQWSTNANFTSLLGSSLVDANGNLSFVATNTGTQTYYARAFNGFCYSNVVTYTYSVVAGVSNLQVTNNGATFCQGQNISFTAGAVGANSYSFYKFSNGTGLIYTGATYTPQPSDYVLGVAQNIFVQASNSNGCQTALLPITYTVFANPTNIQTTGNAGTYCINSPIMIIPTATGGGAGTTFEWSNNSNFSTILGNNFVDVNGNLNYNPSGSGTFTFFVRAKSVNGCVSTSATVTFTVSASVSNVTVTPQNPSVCFGQNVIFTATAQNATSYKWTSDNQGVNVLGTNPTITLSQANYSIGGNTIFLTVTNGGSCNANPIPVAFTINPTPSTLITTGNQGTYCSGNAVLITANSSVGAEIQWSTNSNFTSILGASFVNSNGELSYTPTVPSSPTYYVRAFNGTCYSNVEMVTFTVSAGVGTLQVSNDGATFCQGQNISFTAGATGASEFLWYKFPNATGLLFTGSTYTPLPSEIVNGLNTVYVKANSSNGNCATPIKTITFTINEAPTGIAYVGQNIYCKGQQVLISPSALGQNLTYQWSSTSNFATGNILGSNFVDTNGNLNFPAVNTGTFTYYVRAYNGSCYSNGIPVTITINIQPTNLAVTKLTNTSSTTYCQNGSVEQYLATGVNVSQYKWYYDASLTQELVASFTTGTNNNTFNLNPLDWSIGAHNVYVVGLNSNGCITNPIQINFTIISGITPVLPNINNFTICKGATKTVTLDNPNNFTVSWYSNSAGTQLLSSAYISNNGNTLNLPADDFPIGNNTLYYKIQNSGNCSSALLPLSFSVLATPINIAVTNNNATFCSSQTLTFEASGQNVTQFEWYQDFQAGLVVDPQYINGTKNFRLTIPVGGLPSGNYNYQVVAVNASGCSSAPINVQFTIQDVPTSTTLTGATSFCQSENIQYTLTNASAVTYQWFNDANALNAVNAQYLTQGGSILNIPATQFAVGTHTLFYRATNGNCNSAIQSVTFTVKATPTSLNTNGNQGAYCVGDTVDIIVGSQGGATNYQWFEDAAASLQVNPVFITGATNERLLTAGLPAGMYTYFVRAINSNGCQSALLPIAFSVNPKPNIITFSAPSTTIVEQSPIVFNVNATGYTKWKLLFNGNQIIPAGNNFNNGTITSINVTNNATANNQGTYTFIASNGTCQDVKTFQVYIIPQIIITHNKLNLIGIDNGESKVILKQHDNITFSTNISTNNNYSEQWTYGDGFNNSTVSGLHYYNNAGEFNVTLKVTNNINGDSFTVPYEFPILVKPEENVIPTNTLDAPDTAYTIYPNPYKEFLGLKYEGQGAAGDKFVLRIYAITGLSVFNTDWVADGVNWNKKWYNPLINTPSGTYIVVINNVTKGTTFQAKLLKQ